MRDHEDRNWLWSIGLRFLYQRSLDRDIDLNPAELSSSRLYFVESASHSRSTRRVSCTWENSAELHNRLNHVKFKWQWFGINPDSNTIVTVVVSSFIGKLGKWCSERGRRIHQINNVDESVDEVQESFIFGDSKVNGLTSLIDWV